MWTKRILIFLPLGVALFLLQSYFWVPTYEEQARIAPDRLSHHITASIGDAEILNPILNADNASSSICGMVFEGLIDRDEDLQWRGRLAESWTINEEAYLLVDPQGKRSPQDIVDAIRKAQEANAGEETALGRCLRNITELAIEPAEQQTHQIKERLPTPEGAPPAFADVTLTFKRPARIKFSLTSVDQDLFSTLEEALGKDYVPTLNPSEYIEVTPAEYSRNLEKYAEQFLLTTEHNPVITFVLRQGVKFHDGEQFDANDVKFTYDAIINPLNLSPRIPDYEPVKSVEILDRYTVRIVYKRLYSPAFSSWSMGILPEHLLNNEALAAEAARKGKPPKEFSMRDSDFNLHPIGSGPLKFAEWRSDQFIQLRRFDDYWEGAPEFERYTFRVIPDVLTQELEFYAGSVDRYGAQPHQVARLKNDDRFQNFSGLSLGYTYIGYNMRRDLFKDRRVRQALGLAVDVGRIIKYVLHDEAEPITGPFPKQTDFYDHSIAPLSYDPDRALALLAEAGWKPGKDGWLEKDGQRFEFSLITNNGNPQRLAVMTVAQDSWKKLGIDCKTDTIEWSVFISKYIDKGDFDACVLGWSMGFEPDLYQIWHSSQSGPRQLNFVAFQNAEADDLIVRIRREYNRERQVKLCHRLHRIIADEQPYTFLYVGKSTAVLDKHLFRVVRNDAGEIVGYRRILPTKTGNYTFHFNEWLRLPDMPERVME